MYYQNAGRSDNFHIEHDSATRRTLLWSRKEPVLMEIGLLRSWKREHIALLVPSFKLTYSLSLSFYELFN